MVIPEVRSPWGGSRGSPAKRFLTSFHDGSNTMIEYKIILFISLTTAFKRKEEGFFFSQYIFLGFWLTLWQYQERGDNCAKQQKIQAKRDVDRCRANPQVNCSQSVSRCSVMWELKRFKTDFWIGLLLPGREVSIFFFQDTVGDPILYYVWLYNIGFIRDHTIRYLRKHSMLLILPGVFGFG